MLQLCRRVRVDMTASLCYDVDMTPRFPKNPEDAIHLEERMAERRISWDEIATVVDNPNKIVPGHSGRLNYYAVVAARRLRVTIDGATGEVFTIAVAQGN